MASPVSDKTITAKNVANNKSISQLASRRQEIDKQIHEKVLKRFGEEVTSILPPNLIANLHNVKLSSEQFNTLSFINFEGYSAIRGSFNCNQDTKSYFLAIKLLVIYPANEELNPPISKVEERIESIRVWGKDKNFSYAAFPSNRISRIKVNPREKTKTRCVFAYRKTSLLQDKTCEKAKTIQAFKMLLNGKTISPLGEAPKETEIRMAR